METKSNLRLRIYEVVKEADHAGDARQPRSTATSDTGSELQKMCWNLFERVRSDHESHFAGLDKLLSAYFPLHTNWCESHAAKALDILYRVPVTPFSSILLDDPSQESREWDTQWMPQYMLPGLRPNVASVQKWRDSQCREEVRRKEQLQYSKLLQVVRAFDKNSIIIALWLSANIQEDATIMPVVDRRFVEELADYPNSLAELIESAIFTDNYICASQTKRGLSPNDFVATAFGIQDYVDGPESIQARSIVQLFLWTVWQRAVMLLQYYEFGLMLKYQNNWGESSLALGGNMMLNGYLRADYLDSEEVPEYICPWALSLLRTRTDLVGLDIRRLVERIKEQFSDRPARCSQNGPYRCAGDRSESCNRFISKPLEEQHFAHDGECQGEKCTLVPWDRESYLSIVGPRAVSARQTEACDANKLHYCQAGNQTLVISHVWIHGQGGRPEKGIHSCLHQRYCKIAANLECNSYWIDTTCIPEDETLRSEAIKGINSVFRESKITLVCDIDVMEIDIPDADIVMHWEAVMATLLVCDWGVRGWTLLEGIKGNRNLHLLTKHNRTVRFMHGAELLYRRGPIDLVVNLLAIQHLVPPDSDSQHYQRYEEAGHILSHRHASREGDDVIIWSLLCTNKAFRSVEDLVLDVKTIRTGFLLSSAPRSETRGFSWAPRTPSLMKKRGYVYPVPPDYYEEMYPAAIYHSYDGKGSLEGQVTQHGFEARWFVFLFRDKDDFKKLKPWMSEFGHETWETVQLLLEKHQSVALLKAVSADGQAPWKQADQQADPLKKVAVCVSDGSQKWEWKGVYTEPASIDISDDNSTTPLGAFARSRAIKWELMDITLV